MDWVKTALSVGTTIGKIAGMLQGNDGGLIHFGPTGSGVNPAIGQTGFFLDKNGQCWVGNQGRLNWESPSRPAGVSCRRPTLM